jgi:hypothetical protein
MGNVVLDVFIGLVFLYLLYSLLATVLQEIISRWFGLRARMLHKAVRRMLEDEATSASNKVVAFLRQTFDTWDRFFKPQRPHEGFLKAFYQHPTIKYLGEDRVASKPSYLHNHNFANTIVHLLRGSQYDGATMSEADLIGASLNNGTLADGTPINQETLRHLRMLMADARRDPYAFRARLEDWFDETMQRTTGWYKKQTQLILFFVGLMVAINFNVDSIAIARILINDKDARNNLVAFAASRQQAYTGMIDTLRKQETTRTVKAANDSLPITETTIVYQYSDSGLQQQYSRLQQDHDAVQGILGLNALPNACDTCCGLIDLLRQQQRADTMQNAEKRIALQCRLRAQIDSARAICAPASPYRSSPGTAFIGWLITAFAISLGAPFWFDLLNKFMTLRGSGPKPVNGPATGLPPGATGLSPDTNQPIIKG